MANPTLPLVILAVTDLPAMTAFYRDVLRWQQVVDVPVYVELQADGGMRLGLYAVEQFARVVGETPAPRAVGLSRTELYLHCDDLPDAIDRAQRAGARSLSPRGPRAWGDEAAYVADPEGNVVVLARPL